MMSEAEGLMRGFSNVDMARVVLVVNKKAKRVGKKVNKKNISKFERIVIISYHNNSHRPENLTNLNICQEKKSVG